MDQQLTDTRGAEELAKARLEDEGFSAATPAEGETPADERVDAADVTVEQWANAQALIKKFATENTQLRSLLRRYQEAYGELED